jgi:CubicO group peptidase (beta-lactamase class C family)
MKLVLRRYPGHLAMILALASCGTPFVSSQTQAASSTKPAVTSEVAQHIQRVEAGLIAGIVVKGDPHATHNLADRMKELNVHGVSIAVLHNGSIEWARGFGVAAVGGPDVDAETMFQAGSISKPVATMAALRLVEQGKLSLDVDINTLLKSWKLPADPVTGGKPVTLRELLTHTGGTTVHGFPGYASNETVPSLVQVLNGEKPANTPAIRSEAAPGSKWNYSGGGFTIMQQAVIDATGEPFPKVLHDIVLAPIGMTHSTYEQPLPASFHSFAATPYRGDGKPVEGGAHTYPEMAAAGLWTTPTDLARYAIEVEKSLQGKSNKVLSAEMTRQMLTPGMGKWGLGLEIGGAATNPYFSHGGVNEGFINIFVAYEKNGEGAVVMTNSDNGGALGDEIMHSIAVEYGWPDYQPKYRTVTSVDPKVLAQYPGTYELQPGFNLVVTIENGQLMGQATGQDKIQLYPSSDTRFFLTVVDAEVEFFKDDQGKVTHLILHQGGRDMKAPKK